MQRGFWGRHTTSLRRLTLIGSLALGVVGCANFTLWDDVTSREFKFKDLYSRTDPLTTLRENPDGDARARAMRSLKEPARNGRPQDQDDAVNYLAQAAVSDPRPLCRLAAIDTLGRFEDSRTSAPLMQAYQNAADKEFTLDHVSSIRCEALTALGKKKTPEAAALLVQAASAPKIEKQTETQLTGLKSADPFKKNSPFSDDDNPAQRNLRLAAIRALGEQGNAQAVPVLIPMLGEKDVAVRDRAYEALQKLTGRKEIPSEPQAWREALTVGPVAKMEGTGQTASSLPERPR